MQKKSLETLLYSTVGIVVMLALLVALNFVAGVSPLRMDLTRDRAYTLSQGTRNILKKLDSTVTIRFYVSQGESATPESVYFKTYAKRVEDLLEEFRQVSGGRIVIKKFNPEPDSDAEDSAHLDGVEGEMLRDGEKFYLGLAVSLVDEKQSIPFLDPNRERLLEYDLAKAITSVVSTVKPVVGIMTPLPVFGMPSNPMMARMGQQGQQPWSIIGELKAQFSVKTVPMDAEKIDDEVRVLVVIHPREITDKAQFAIDQFIMRGGKLVAFLDPTPFVIDSKEQNQMMGNMPNTGSSLDKLLKAWGLAFDTTKVVADLNFKMQLGSRGGVAQEAPAVLDVNPLGLDRNDIVTSQLDSLWLPYAGAFTGTPVAGLKETVLIKSTKDSQLVDGFMANLAAENILKEFKPSGTEYSLAVRLTGKFKTAFPNGRPEEKKEDDKTGDKKPAASKPGESLKESKETAVLLVGDADMLADAVALEQVQTLFGVALRPRNGNFSFAQNAIEQLSGDSDLISVRSRATLSRPFTRIQAMETAANEKFQSEVKRLEDSANEAQRKINELQQAKKDKDQRFIMSPEQAAELAKLRKEEVETRKHLKKVQKDLHQEVVSLQNTVKWINVLAVPLAVTASGIAIAAIKRKKTSAK